MDDIYLVWLGWVRDSLFGLHSSVAGNVETKLTMQTEFHQILGPALMVAFAFLGNTLFLTVLVSMLSTTFSKIVQDAAAEIQFRRAVQTLEGVKGDAIFAYQPPFNLLAIFILIPLKFLVSPRWFHKIHVFWVRFLNLPLLLIIAFAERQNLWPGTRGNRTSPASLFHSVHLRRLSKPRAWLWGKWRWSITSHSDLATVFDVPPPDSVLSEIATDDELTRHMIRRQFTRNNLMEGVQLTPAEAGANPKAKKTFNRRDSIAPFPGLRAELQGVLSESNEVSDITSRLEALEESTQRIEALLTRLAEGFVGSEIGEPHTRDTHAWATSLSEDGRATDEQ